DTSSSLTIEIYRKIPFNIGYLLASLSHLDVASMDIFTLFDEVKYFKIEFIEHIDADEVPLLEKTINDAFDMSKEAKLKNIVIKADEVSIDCEHSLAYAELSVHTHNQKGLLAFIMECFEKLHINIATAKIHSTKHKVRDSFLMEKQNELCNNVEKIYKILTKNTM
ncbi:MAG: [protein-PII] uridylyltransferase, partial [Campylobacterota bacterium]|nr:[protein-PII] uridylyltransferase [Campylobacterota bacterium]